MRKDPQNYLVLLNQLHSSQERMLGIIEQIMELCVPTKRQERDYLLKFPDEIAHENMATQILFAAELLVGGTYIEVEEADGSLLRPLAQELLHSLADLRYALREQSFEDPGSFPETIHKALLHYDRLSAEFELRYVSLLVSVKTPEEIYSQQEVAVLFCETVSRALKKAYLTQEMIDYCEPELMISIPRLAIISGLLIYPDGPLNLQKRPEEMCELFRPFHGLLKKIQELLGILTEQELISLERALCSASSDDSAGHLSSISDSPNKWNFISHANGSLPEPSSTIMGISDNPRSEVPSSWETQSTGIQCQSPVTMHSNCTSNYCKSDRSHKTYRDQGVIKTAVFECSGNAEIEYTKLQHHNLHVKYSHRNLTFQHVRSRYRSDSDMLHRLFVCIAGVADQLQTNFASDLRVILKTVFETVSSKQQEEREKTTENAFRLPDCCLCQNNIECHTIAKSVPPEWLPDNASSHCMSCYASFTLLRRRHHCRSCGKIFCSQCSAYSSTLPYIISTHPVRVCSHCFHVHCNPLNSHRMEQDWTGA
ncbi:zinc finger FYVE-type containing 28 L homeolog [Xenopus laevis]|uniref:MGC83588 protein n=1 Tax=Xenopus laevis TaxID=8355 RepID=Q6DCE1_XENLA|nr:zinc finger FYVE-type containing 28b L homeolog [Xenopus laevis]AAH78106.1 MGC83588 protein [Xenopus laevis]